MSCIVSDNFVLHSRNLHKKQNCIVQQNVLSDRQSQQLNYVSNSNFNFGEKIKIKKQKKNMFFHHSGGMKKIKGVSRQAIKSFQERWVIS